MQSTSLNSWLLYCRPGFEADCAQETQAKLVEASSNSGFAVVQGKPRLMFSQLVFARQFIRLLSEVKDLPERDRIIPLLAALPAEPLQFSEVWLEVPDTNEGKALSGFTRRLQPLLEAALVKAGRLGKAQSSEEERPRLHVFFPSKNHALIGSSDPGNSAAWPMGILRQKMPFDAPSRSYLKLAEAFETFLGSQEQKSWLRPGMHAVDLGAAPGGWTWQLVQRGLKVIAVDNGPLKGAAADHVAIKHLRQDGFRYRPQQPVDWVVCDMVEQPQRVAALMTEWIASGLAARAIFNLKLPMKKRLEALNGALGGVRAVLEKKSIRYRLQARHLYHDREEVTVFLARVIK